MRPQPPTRRCKPEGATCNDPGRRSPPTRGHGRVHCDEARLPAHQLDDGDACGAEGEQKPGHKGMSAGWHFSATGQSYSMASNAWCPPPLLMPLCPH